MDFKKICYVTVLICLEGDALVPVSHTVVDEIDVTDTDIVSVYFKRDRKQVCVSLRQLYPVAKEDERPPEIFLGRPRHWLISKRLAKRGFERIVLLTSIYCRPDWVEQAKELLVAECSKALRDRAAFQLNCIDALDDMA
uniref:hypothetical protein n=1 Tax=Pseudomonas aeruginosa TaxID=287 RepID=UPI00093E03EE|nr:hypothetical protein [Pseudomonas aeruginosa]